MRVTVGKGNKTICSFSVENELDSHLASSAMMRVVHDVPQMKSVKDVFITLGNFYVINGIDKEAQL